MWCSRIVLAAATAVAVVSVPAVAQDSTACVCPSRSHTPSAFARRSSGSFAFLQSRPQGEFRGNVGLGYGGAGAFLFALDQNGVFALRADAGILGYGNESKRVPLSESIGGRVDVTVSTSNYIVPVAFGPQLTWPSGPIRPYVNAGVGAQFFFTESSVGGADGAYDFAHTTNQSDATAAWVAGAGVLVPVHQRGLKVLLDAGAQWYNGGRAQYLRPGSIQDLPNAQIAVTPLQSETHMLLIRLGVKIGI